MSGGLSNLIRKFFPKSAAVQDSQLFQCGFPVYDVTAFAGEIDLSSFDVLQWAPAWMSRAERLMVYTLIFGLRPLRYLEIGTFQGGSAVIVAAAMNASSNPGRMVCVDPEPRIEPEHWEKLKPRATLLKGFSPDILPRAYKAAGGFFDFVFIDGDHSEAGVKRDANGVLPYVTSGSYILFHDCFFSDVAKGIDAFLDSNAGILKDYGPLTREVTSQSSPEQGLTWWGGLRLMQVFK